MKQTPTLAASTATAVSGAPAEKIEITVTQAPAADELAAWDQLVANLPGSDVTQLSRWATVRSTAGYTPLYLLARGGGVLLGGALVLIRRVPLIGRLGYVSYGPIVADAPQRATVVGALADALLDLARTRLRALFVQPVAGEDISSALLERGFRLSTAGVAPAATVRIDLSAPEESLRAGLSKRIRRWTNKWADAGVTVRRGGPDDLGVLLDLLRSTAQHQGFVELAPDYVHTLHRELARGGQVELFVGEVHGEPVVAEMFTNCGGVLRCRLTGMNRSSAASTLSVTAAVDWEAIRWAKKRGMAGFDFGGLSAEAAAIVADQGLSSTELDGASRFKVAFGGRYHVYPRAVELIPSPIVRRLYDSLASGSVGQVVLDRARRWMRHGTGALRRTAR
jgi:lipid II:glycine glycyltransferase (peptidoglycan interpeptide bridge formation enzyme)